MAQPVWTLSVDLQTKTATFTSGLADAAKGARSSFEDIKSGADDMGRGVSGSMTEARHGVMLLGEEFGVHLPRSLTTFIASIGPIGAAMEAAFPFLAILVGATLLIEHLMKLKEAGAAIDSDWAKIGDSASGALNRTKDAILEAEIEADKFSGDKLDALHKRLILIDHQSMRELVSEFNKVGDEIDKVLEKSSRGTIMSTLLGEGAANKVKSEFDSFREQYTALLNTGKDSQARGALVDEIIHAQDQLKKYQAMPQSNPWVADAVKDYGQLIDKLDQLNTLQDYNTTLNSKKKENVVSSVDDSAARAEYANAEKYDDLIAKAHKKLNDELEKQADDIGKIQGARLRSQVESEVKAQKEIAEAAKLAQEAGKEDAGHGSKMAELQLAADKEAGQLRIAQGRMTEQQILDMEMSFNAQEYSAKQKALNDELAALDPYAKDYENKKRALNNRLLELDKQFENQDAALVNAAQKKELADVTASENRMKSVYAQGFAEVLMRKQSFGQMMGKLDEQIAQTALQNAIESLMQKKGVDGQTRFEDARTAAADAFRWAGNPILGIPAAAGAFAAVMAFEGGGLVPGVGSGDIVPARLEPGEGIITKKVMEGLSNRAKFGGDDKTSGDTHVHHTAHYHINAVDGASVKGMLEKHADEFTQHFHRTLRKLNR
jgi:hypothetical protein